MGSRCCRHSRLYESKVPSAGASSSANQAGVPRRKKATPTSRPSGM